METYGFLYQHMDSRGGTTFVIAPTREEADAIYLTVFTGGAETTPEDIKWLNEAVEDDLVAQAIIESEERLPDGELLGGWLETKPRGTVASIRTPSKTSEGEMWFLVYDPDGDPDAENVERWDDDAYGFVVMR